MFPLNYVPKKHKYKLDKSAILIVYTYYRYSYELMM